MLVHYKAGQYDLICEAKESRQNYLMKVVIATSVARFSAVGPGYLWSEPRNSIYVTIITEPNDILKELLNDPNYSK